MCYDFRGDDMKKELLAPAGDIEAGYAALYYGADAVYLGLKQFSARATAICDKNVKENFPQANNHRSITADVLDYMEQMEKGSYDLIILDPPAFAKHQRHTQQALKGYRAINRKAIEKIASGGLLFTVSCSQAVSSDEFATMLFSCAALSGRKVRIIKRLAAGGDHPQSIFHPEGEDLTGMLLYIE